jgi:hypothetical protein
MRPWAGGGGLKLLIALDTSMLAQAVLSATQQSVPREPKAA